MLVITGLGCLSKPVPGAQFLWIFSNETWSFPRRDLLRPVQNKFLCRLPGVWYKTERQYILENEKNLIWFWNRSVLLPLKSFIKHMHCWYCHQHQLNGWCCFYVFQEWLKYCGSSNLIVFHWFNKGFVVNLSKVKHIYLRKNVSGINDLSYPTSVCVSSRLQNNQEFGAVGLWLLLNGWDMEIHLNLHQEVLNLFFEAPRRTLMSAAPPYSVCSMDCSWLLLSSRHTPLSKDHSSNEDDGSGSW